ncbi:FAD-dependent oxidoreductase [Hydrogenophaga sp. IBVHS1]|uniref:FAD-dependent oxidoreductase n=1 Tax=unclassified Hydrogenophaga TaxID=2610897 RepID=UPI000A2D601C|nr:FAD-dependent oxidoreductase [Hydrogenophaga sp. IBVHS1]OSZ73051.1 glutathione-disulfide reductase [Hydrogenophaga sp. IBVHS1]
MTSFDFDLFVIGGGSGGVRAARMAAQRGARVGLAEVLGNDGLGGTCVNVGCIPKKLYSYAAHYGEAFEESQGFGWEFNAPTLPASRGSLPPEGAASPWGGPAEKPWRPTFNWATLKANRAREISRLNGVYGNLLRGSGVTVFEAFARVTGANRVALSTLNADGSPGHQEFTAKHILIATGGTPHVPHFVGREHVITSNEVFDLEPFPQRLVVVGGGYIASEFASIFNGLGSKVTQLYRGEQILRGFDDEIRHFVSAEMVKAGVDLHLNAGVVDVRQTDAGLRVECEGGALVMADAVLYATGRVPNVADMGLETVGVALGARGEVIVNEHYQTNVPSIFALGDVTNRLQLTPVALGEAMVVVDQLFGPAAGKAPRSMGYEFVPTAVFTHPSIGTVGYSEAQAREKFGDVTIFRSEFKALKHTLSGSTERTLMKLVVDTKSDRVVGLHMVGAEAGEIVQGFAVAMKAGATKAVFDSTIGIHPTAAEEFVTMREPVKS